MGMNTGLMQSLALASVPGVLVAILAALVNLLVVLARDRRDRDIEAKRQRAKAIGSLVRSVIDLAESIANPSRNAHRRGPVEVELAIAQAEFASLVSESETDVFGWVQKAIAAIHARDSPWLDEGVLRKCFAEPLLRWSHGDLNSGWFAESSETGHLVPRSL